MRLTAVTQHKILPYRCDVFLRESRRISFIPLHPFRLCLISSAAVLPAKNELRVLVVLLKHTTMHGQHTQNSRLLQPPRRRR